MKKKEGLLLNTELEIKITNDGKDNLVSFGCDKNTTVKEVMVSLGLVKKDIEASIEMYLLKTNKERGQQITESEFKKLFETITLEEVYVKINQ